MIRSLDKNDIVAAAKIHAEAFPRQQHSEQWLACALGAYPRTLCYVLEQDKQVLAYIIWSQKSGFRVKTVLELEQIAVAKPFQNKGFAQALIKASLKNVKAELERAGSSVHTVLVSTSANNHAQTIYRKVLGAEVEATISGLFSSDEVFMIAKNIDQ